MPELTGVPTQIARHSVRPPAVSPVHEAESDVRRVPAKLVCECRIGSREWVVPSDVDPGRGVNRSPLVCKLDQVMPPEVRRIVEGTGWSLAGLVPERRGMRADRTEAGRGEAREVERAETAHRNASDRDAPVVGARAVERDGNSFAQYGG